MHSWLLMVHHASLKVSIDETNFGFSLPKPYPLWRERISLSHEVRNFCAWRLTDFVIKIFHTAKMQHNIFTIQYIIFTVSVANS